MYVPEILIKNIDLNNTISGNIFKSNKKCAYQITEFTIGKGFNLQRRDNEIMRGRGT